MSAKRLAGLLGDANRARVWAALLLSPGTTADDAGLAPAEVTKALRQLAAAGLVSETDGVWTASTSPLVDAAAGRDSDPGADEPDAQRAAVLRAFLDGSGRLRDMPTAIGKRRVILDHIAQSFEPGMRYAERHVDEVLKGFHPDNAALRRYLVDEGLLSREANVYWRSGGGVELSA